MASNQRRCVFVGNIPYDATEEQLVQICEEVGPVVSFRLVIDRETGRPKGYGFCEYKDEETALSARRNLQGYEINGRQLRVDFAENDKTADRSREQGRGGLCMPSNVDSQKQMGGLSVPGDSSRYQPIGLHSAITAAAAVAGALGAVPAGMNQNVLPGQSAAINDPLTLHLAKLSRSQLTDVISELKMMITQNKESARKLLLARPQLAKALFQAQMMLGLVTPQMLQILSNQKSPDQFSQHSLRDSQQDQLPGIQSLPGLPLAQTKVQSAMMTKIPGGQVPATPQNLFVQNQMFASQQPTIQPRIQIQRETDNQVLQPSLPPVNSGSSTLTSLHLPSSGPQMQVADPSQNLSIRPLPEHKLGLSRENVVINSVIQRSQAGDDASLAHRSDAHSTAPMGVIGKRMVSDFSDQLSRPSKMLRMEDVSSASFPVGNSYLPNKSGHGPPDTSGLGKLPNPVNKTEEGQYCNKQTLQVAPEMESALLQQVLSLTPEQLSLLPSDQQQQLIQLQQALREGQFQPS